MTLYSALRAISVDAKNNCNLDLGIPVL